MMKNIPLTIVIFNDFVDVDKVLNLVKTTYEELGYNITYEIYYEEVPEDAINEERQQFNAIKLLEFLKKYYKKEFRVIGLTNVDIYYENLNFVFGIAEQWGKYALVSCFRLQEIGVRGENLTILRCAKEILHELGHTFGLEHCINNNCVMSFSSSVVEVDEKDLNYCNNCKEILLYNLNHILKDQL